MSRSGMMITIAFSVLSVTSQARALQSSVKWIDDSEAGVAAAQKSSLPILFLLLPPSDAPASDKNKVLESFGDPAVSRLVGDRFVAVGLRQSRAAEGLLKRLNASDAPVGSAVIATPGGGRVDIIATDDVQDAPRLAKRLAEAFAKYQAKVLADSVTPVLGDEDAKTDALLVSLRLVKKLGLTEADQSTAKLLDRKTLPDAVRAAVYDTLAALSTDRAMGALLDAARQDAKAVAALRLCTPAGAKALVSALKLGDPDKLVLAYDAAIAICSMAEGKPTEFWKGTDETSQEAELERVKARISTCVQAWRESGDHRD